ncbi:MAG: hypothetical protein PVF33_12595, partial [Candidatus Latescibacterota bacterium]
MKASKRRKKKPARPARSAWPTLLYKVTGRIDPFYIGFYALSLILCFILFRGLSDNHLFNDDFEWLAKARYEMTLGNVLAYRVIGFFRPIVNLSYFAMERIAPGNLWLYYYENVLLHFVNSMLVFHLILCLVRDRTIAALTAVFFIVTSVHCAAVFWISARTTLIFTLFLLSSLLVLMRPPWNRRKLFLSLLLYALALLTKETAVVGVLLVGMLYLFYRKKEGAAPDKTAVIAFFAVTVAYLVVRSLVIGRFVQPNWGPGAHALRNIAGGALYQLMPWVLDWLLTLTRELFGFGKPFIRDGLLNTTNAVFPEILIVPIAAAMLIVARILNRQREMIFAISWTVICLIPMAFLKFRFLTMNSFAHNRYYYLSSVGACLAMVLVLAILWEPKRIRRYGRVVAAVILGLTFVSEAHRVKIMEVKWHNATYVFNDLLNNVEKLLGEVDSYNYHTLVVETVPMKYPYFKSG